MKVLITGGAGFIGSHTADELLAQGHDVRVLDSLTKPVHPVERPPNYLDPRIEFVKGDVRDEETLVSALNGCDAVYHLAAFQDYLPTFSTFFDVNVTATALLYEVIIRDKLPIKKVIVASSQAALGEGAYEDQAGRMLRPDIRPISQLTQGLWDIQAPPGYQGPLNWIPTPEDSVNPQNQYALSKMAEEQIALSLGKRYELPSVAMRYSIVQGPRQSVHNAYSGACRVFSLSFKANREPIIYEDGEQVRDFINIHDVVAANVLVLEDDRAEYEMFNVGGGEAISVNSFARSVAKCFAYSEDYQPKPSGRFRFGDTRHIVSDTSKLVGLGWKPTRGVEDSVEEYLRWLADQDVEAEMILDRSAEEMLRRNVVRDVEN